MASPAYHDAPWFVGADESGLSPDFQPSSGRVKTPHSLSRPGSKLRPRTKERGRSRGDSRPNTRGSLGSTSRASTPQLVEPLKPVDPKTAAAASLLSFQIRQSKSSKKTAQKMKNIAYLVKFELLIVPAIVVAILIVKSASKLIIARDSAANTRGPHGIS